LTKARLWHPDKNSSEAAQLKFQAISWAYEYLRNPTTRAEYDETGTLPQEDQDISEEGTAQWKRYFDEIFGRVDARAINDFALQYKMSVEEEKDVLSNYEKFKGDMTKMLEHVMLSEERDCSRWIEDYIKPAVAARKVIDYSEKLSVAMKRIRRNLDKKTAQVADPDKTDTEGSEEDTKNKPLKPSKRKKVVATKARATKDKQSSGDDALVAAIRARRARGDPFAALGARYGVSMDDYDPLDDKTFASLQNKNKRKK
jgi:DnaJ homolog subfamily C member 9